MAPLHASLGDSTRLHLKKKRKQINKGKKALLDPGLGKIYQRGTGSQQKNHIELELVRGRKISSAPFSWLIITGHHILENDNNNYYEMTLQMKI